MKPEGDSSSNKRKGDFDMASRPLIQQVLLDLCAYSWQAVTSEHRDEGAKPGSSLATGQLNSLAHVPQPFWASISALE